jgi:hypothetical protein
VTGVAGHRAGAPPGVRRGPLVTAPSNADQPAKVVSVLLAS